MSNSDVRRKMLRVLHITGLMNRGGAESRLMDLVRQVDRRENIFDFCVFNDEIGDYDPELMSLGCDIVRCKRTRNVFSFMWRLYRMLKKSRYDVVDSNILFFSGICLAAARLAGIRKRVIHFHNTNDGRKNTLLRRIYRKIMLLSIRRNATDIIGVSQAVLTAWFGPNWQQTRKDCLVYNGLDCTEYHCKSDPKWLKTEFN